MGAGNLGILVAISVFVQFVVLYTIVKSLGMMLIYIQADFGARTWVLGSVFAVVESVGGLLGPVPGPIGRVFGARPVSMAGGIAVTVGLAMASQASNILVLALLLNTLVAGGSCFVNILARAELGKHFDVKHYALVTGLVQTGGPFALITQPPLTQLFLNTYGWRGAMLILASLSAHFVVSGALLLPRKVYDDADSQCTYQPLKQMAAGASQPKQPGFLTSVFDRIYRTFDLSLMRDYHFWMVALVYVVCRISRGAWTIYFVPHVVEKGLTNDQAAVLVTIAGVGQLAGILLVGVALYTEKVTSTSATLATVTIIAMSSLSDPWMTSYWSIAVNATVFMFGVGSTFTVTDVMVKEFLGQERMASAFGWMGFFSGIFRFFSGFIPGWIYDHSGSYDLAFIILGALQMTSVIPLIFKCCYDLSHRS